jgi:hypothetical protein
MFFTRYHTYTGTLLIDALLHVDEVLMKSPQIQPMPSHNGIRQLVEDYEAKAGLQVTIPWPFSEVAVLTVQYASYRPYSTRTASTLHHSQPTECLT